MDPLDSELDERLRAASKPHPDAVERVTARALASPERGHRLRGRLLALATTAAILVAVVGLRYWPRHPAQPPVAAQDRVGVVLVRAPDGSSSIYSTGADADTLPPGSGFVISEEGDQQ